MTETPRTAVCPDCSALVPYQPEALQNHRGFHNDLKAKHDGVRKRIGEQDDKITRAATAATAAQRAADNIHIPEPAAPLEISTAGDDWADLPDYTPITDEEPVDEPPQQSQYVDDIPGRHQIPATIYPTLSGDFSRPNEPADQSNPVFDNPTA